MGLGWRWILTDVLDLGVLHDEFMHGYGCDPEQDTGDNHGDQPRNPAKNTG